MCPFIGFSLDYAAESQIFETKGKKFYFKRNPQKCGIPQNEISHQKQDISSHIWIIYLHGWFELFLVVLFFLIIFVSVLWTILNDWKFVFDSQSTVLFMIHLQYQEMQFTYLKSCYSIWKSRIRRSQGRWCGAPSK